MAFNLTRMTVYALVSSLESDLRSIICNHISCVSKISPDLRLRSIERLCKDIGLEQDEFDGSVDDLVTYFDLGDTFQTINSNKDEIPQNIVSKIKGNNKKLEGLIPIRNRVMHIRPLHFQDLPYVSSLCEALIDEDETIWVHTHETLKRLQEEPSFVLALEIPLIEQNSLKKHNLPLPDFDETGLIGRDEDVDKVRKLCLGSFPVISIVGEGGVGKTALAIKIAYDLLEDENSPFDAVIWVSSKTSQITVSEIVEFKDAISDSLGILREIGTELVGEGLSQQETFDEIIDYLATFRIALFIDNLETILDDNIRNFIGSLPQGSKIIITSRIGLGAFEYPVKLQGIAETYASQLLRTLARLRNVEALSSLPQSTLIKYVNRMHRNPSYIKWFVSCIQTGISPESVLQNSELFLEFCMSNVYKYLSSDAIKLTDSIQCAPGLKDIPELAYLTDFVALDVQRAIQELMATNMLTQSSISKGSSVKTTYQLSELAREYLAKYHKPSSSFQRQIKHKRNKLNSIFESQMKRKTADNYNTNNIKFRDKADRVIAKMLTDAQSYAKQQQYSKAFELMEEARRMSPDYFEVARVSAQFHETQGNLSDARSQYELAILLSPDTSQLHYWFGKFLLKSEDNLDDALPHLIKANDLDRHSIDVALALARAYMFKGEFSRTDNILIEIEPKIVDKSSHNNKMFLDTQIQIHYRKADQSVSEGNFDDALLSLESMMVLFEKLPEQFKDKYMRKKLKKAQYISLKVFRNCSVLNKAKIEEFVNWLERESI
jgi:LuxR family glucitol operon transcriptional activator